MNMMTVCGACSEYSFVWNLSMGGSLNVSEDPGYGSRSVLIAHALCACFKSLGWK